MKGLATINIKFAANLKQFSSQMQNANRRIAKMGKNMQRVGGQLSLGLTAPLTAFGGIALKTFGDFEQEMAKVKAVSGATAQQFNALKKSALDLGATTRFSASQVAQLQLNYSKLGFTTTEILKATKATLDLSVASGEDLANSATVAASTIRAFGLTAEDSTHVVDVMAKSFSSSALDLEKFKTAMGVLGPVAKTAGVSLEEATGYLSVLVNAGIDASTAGTGLRNIFLDIAKKGISLNEALGKISSATNKNAVAMDLFGKRGATVATVMAANIRQGRELANTYLNSAGAAKEMASIVDNTLQGSLLSLQSSVEGMLISFGEVLAPALRKVASLLSDVAGWFRNLSPETKKFVVILGGIAAAIGPLLALAGTILPAIATGFTLLAGPVGLIVAGLVAIGTVIYKNWQPIKKELVNLANYFIDLYNESTAFRLSVEAWGLTFKTVYSVASTTILSLIRLMASGLRNMFDSLGAISQFIKGLFTQDYSLQEKALKRLALATAKNFGAVAKSISGDFENTFVDIQKSLSDSVQRLANKKYKVGNFKLSNNVNEIPTIKVPAVLDFTKKGSKTISAGSLDKEGGKSNTKLDPLESAETDGQSVFDPVFERELAAIEAFNDNVSFLLQDVATNAITSFASALGKGDLKGVLNGLLSVIADAMIQLGRLAIQAGIAIKGIKAALSSLNPVLAIAAGAALVALGTVIKSGLGDVAGNFAGSYANGGIVPGSSFSGDKLFARVNSGEMILNRRQQGNLLNMLQPASAALGPLDVMVHVEGSISGENIDLVTKRYQVKQRRNN